jgi:hypothetical protein
VQQSGRQRWKLPILAFSAFFHSGVSIAGGMSDFADYPAFLYR